ncbi:MAG: GNAT family N-acetyltransferase [Bacteroidota bacterium]
MASSTVTESPCGTLDSYRPNRTFMTGVTYITTPKEKKAFLEFPYSHYKGDAHWVPPLKFEVRKRLDPEKNPFFQQAEMALFIAEQDGEIAGRIAAIIDHRYNSYHDTKTGFFGFFESINSESVTDLLFRSVSGWLEERGIEKLMGPASPSMMDEVGILVDGFDQPPAIMMPYNKQWYGDLLESAGFQKEMDLFAFDVDQTTVDRERMSRAVGLVKRRIPGLTVRPIRLKKMQQEIEIIRHIFNKAWSQNWGFIPLSKAELEQLASDLKLILDPDFAHIVEVDGDPVAFSVALPDYNQILAEMNGTLFPTGIFKLLLKRKSIHRIRTALMGVLPAYRGKGIDAVLHHQSIENGLVRDFHSSELSWVLESNTEMIRVAERIGARRSKTYRIYSKSL